MTREFYTPSTYDEKIEREDLNVVIYITGEKSAMGFGGKRSAPDFNYRFHSTERRDLHIAEYIASAERNAAYKAERKAAKKAFTHDVKVGSIFYDSWGYEQTNVDFYEVVKMVGKKSVLIKSIGKSRDGGGSYTEVVAVPGSYSNDDEGMVKRIGEGNYIRMNSFSSASLWDGKPKYETGAGYGH